MANIEQLELLQERIGSEPVIPDALDRYRALKMLQKRPIKREGGGQLDTIEDIASKGRYGDTMLMHVNPREVSGLDSLGKMTYNPETGLPEAWLWALPLAGAAIGGIGAKLMDKDPLTGALLGGGIGLGGMGLAGAGASGLGGLFGSGSAGALPGLWKGLTPIGQGMLMGGAMGGVRGLFGQSESPMKDILLGAAMGGVGGALFGGAGTATGAAEAELAASDAFTAGVSPSIEVPSAVSKIGSTVVAPTPSSTIAQGGSYLGYRPVPVPPTSYSTPTLPIHAPGFRSADIPLNTTYGLRNVRTPGLDISGRATNPVMQTEAQREAARRAVTATDIGEKAATTTTPTDPDKTFFGGLKDWWKDREWYEKAGLAGLGAWGATELLSGREQAELEEPEPIQPFEKGERKTPLQPIQPLTEEQILAAYSGPSGTGIDTWFEPQVAKEGGLVELDAGGTIINNKNSDIPKLSTGTSGYMGDPAYRAGVRAGPGGAVYYPPGYSGPAYKNERGNLYWTSAKHDEPLPLAPAPPPPPPPEVTDPFVSNVSSFNVQDALSRITGQSAVPEQITLPTPSQLPALATSSQLPAGNIQQGASALSDLFSRFQQAQGDPIVDIVTATEAVPETAREGGLVELDAGGTIINNKNSDIPKYWVGSKGPGPGSLGTYGLGTVGGGQSGGSQSGGSGSTNYTTVKRAGDAPPNVTTMNLSPPNLYNWTNAISGKNLARGRALGNLMAAVPGWTLGGRSAGEGNFGTVVNMGIAGLSGMKGIVGAIAGEMLGLPSVGEAVFGPTQGRMAINGESNTAMGFGPSNVYGLPAGQQTMTAGQVGRTGQPMSGTESYVFGQEGAPAPAWNVSAMKTKGLAAGGIFEGRVQGQGDGMADKVAFNVVPQTPADIPNTPDMALLSSDEYVVPADVVSMLGNGSSTAGAQALDQFNQLMRKKAHGTNKQQKELNAGKELSSLV